ncbi:unnamed protein product [Hermetia illucens]|uniref:Protein sleepless n=1 Tax=Hermetia illucens TaxID=343691 RepID=A0A7R8Z1L3_HERIL|nr:uncharacterized protein LOC119660155 [Hermetia illucens]XP_037924488.1 uncharacterized protein LOC119660155 [Hermetia illucens]CAD7092691.1 unnamed protein product [Hermetia illucens]
MFLRIVQHIQNLGLIIAIFVIFVKEAYCIDCFKCVSFNGANKACDDPFHNNYSTAILESPCMGGRKGRDGLFPATACIKIAGYYDDTGETITVRGCALDSGTLTTDTEIIRMSHCGRFYYDDRYVHGCLQSCNDADACNASERSVKMPIMLQMLGAMLLLLLLPSAISR